MNKLVACLLLTLLGLAACSTAITKPAKQGQTSPVSAVSQQLRADFTDNSQQMNTVYDFFGIAVRTERGNPKGKPATFGRKAKVNTVRMLGGWYNQDLNGDTYLWDGEKYVYNFEAATKRIDSWLNNDWDIFQIVLDNPPWAFQRGYQFVDQPNGKNYLKKDRVGVYGNGLPPNDAKAWQDYIQAFIQHLVLRYGKETVLSWRFRVGSEIDTRPQHWSATMQEFFDHYQNTVQAVKTVLPEAVIGTHFREATHKSQYLDYTGNKEDAYAPHFVAWAKQHNVPYDFLAISYYPHITHPHEIDMDEVYQGQIAPILEHPDYNPKASFEIHEYKFIVKMKRAGFVSVATSHNSAFFAMLSKMMLEKNIKEIFQWGNVSKGSYSPEAMTQLALYDMIGNKIFANTVTGTPIVNGNKVDGIFTERPNNQGLDVLTFNFNKDDMSYQTAEQMALSMRVNKPADTSFQYRVAQIDQNVSLDQRFFADFPKANILVSEGGWRLADSHPTASVKNALTAEGQKVFRQQQEKYQKIDKLNWGKWQIGRTVSDGGTGSTVLINNTIPSFAVQKYQIRWLSEPQTQPSFWQKLFD